MFHGPFWILMLIFASVAILSIVLKGFSFIDFQIVVMTIAVSLIFDMVFCKWLNYYAYVVTYELKAFYSLIFCLIGYPSTGIAFLKFLPSSSKAVVLYIATWTAAFTLLEILVKPYGIVIYEKWSIIPHSPIVYAISFTWLYGYNSLLRKFIQ